MILFGFFIATDVADETPTWVRGIFLSEEYKAIAKKRFHGRVEYLANLYENYA
ncbi:hypothetical protein LQZ18_09485 [Lachnospiraceae bacterium ZAX-1]